MDKVHGLAHKSYLACVEWNAHGLLNLNIEVDASMGMATLLLGLMDNL